ncbi:MAG: NADH-quinone oxidoreductase subunit L [Pseudomonadota bacterium]
MNFLYLTFLAPLIGYILLAGLAAARGGRVNENLAAVIGVGSVGVAALAALFAGQEFLATRQPGEAVVQTLWTWFAVDTLTPTIGLHLDGLAVTMLGVITGVGFLIHLFASWYMRGEEGYARYFSYMNLFVASMVMLVLGDNLLALYLGWEGVGLCSYLLIGFFYKETANGNAAFKAFVITRIGDVFMAIGLFILYATFGTLNIQELLVKAPQAWQAGDPMANLAALMLLGGAVGKSAQLPLQTWLADAMAGPTPVSALIHAATMVTAGVYLIARTHGLFLLAPDVLHLVGIVGAITLLLSGFAALAQTDIKRILAYSTMSQIGYMFLALGVGAWSAAIFHLMTHAFFKALLFLSAGAVLIATHHEQDIFKLGGLRRKLPFLYVCFWVGGAALAALPFVTAGFFSKDEILWEALASGNEPLLYAGLAGAFLTSIYTFRLIFIAFHGEEKTEVHAVHGVTYWLPLGVLLVLSTFIGALIHQPLNGVLPEGVGVALKFTSPEKVHQIEIVSGAIAVTGIAIAAFLFLGQRKFVTALADSAISRFFSAWWRAAWGFDWLYDMLFVRPFRFIAKAGRRDGIDLLTTQLPASTAAGLNTALSNAQNGRLRWYAALIGAGVVLLMAGLALV